MSEGQLSDHGLLSDELAWAAIETAVPGVTFDRRHPLGPGFRAVAATQHAATRAAFGLPVVCTHDKELAWDVPGVRRRCQDCGGEGMRWLSAREVAEALCNLLEDTRSDALAYMARHPAIPPILAALRTAQDDGHDADVQP